MKILFINLPDFQTNYQFHKEMGGGMGYKNLRSERTKRNKDKSSQSHINENICQTDR